MVAALKKCNKRSNAQNRLMTATAAGMKDWKSHVKFMQCNAVHREPTRGGRQTTWKKQYRGAPKNIKAFKKATANFKAPDC